MKRIKITNEIREWCAVSTMRDMLFNLADNKNISYEDALVEFADSPIYDLLFDYESGMWKEGPDYLLATYEDYLKNIKTVRST